MIKTWKQMDCSWKFYYDTAGYGSLKNKLADAKEICPYYKSRCFVQQLFNKYVEQKKQAHGTNIFVANGIKY